MHCLCVSHCAPPACRGSTQSSPNTLLGSACLLGAPRKSLLVRQAGGALRIPTAAAAHPEPRAGPTRWFLGKPASSGPRRLSLQLTPGLPGPLSHGEVCPQPSSRSLSSFLLPGGLILGQADPEACGVRDGIVTSPAVTRPFHEASRCPRVLERSACLMRRGWEGHPFLQPCPS